MREVKPLSIAVTVMILVLVGSLSIVHSQGQAEDCQYFSETGHWVCGPFREFFETRGGLEIFGYPLTEEFPDPTLGVPVQYFQRARIEFHAYNPDLYKVLLGLLADELGYIYPPANPAQIPAFNNRLRHYFPESGHVVSYAFLEYFREHGGIDIFGYPRSELVYEDGHTVQYFQRVRMEWRPEDAAGSQIGLTNLGEVYLDRFSAPSEAIAPQPNRPDESSFVVTLDRVTDLSVDASVRHSVAGEEGMQTVFVYVTDQWGQSLSGAMASIAVGYKPGTVVYRCPRTDDEGFTEYSFNVQESPLGQNVVIDVTVAYGKLTNTTQTFYLLWR